MDARRTELLQELESCIERGRTLPAHWYTDQDVLDLETELVFRREWELVSEYSDLSEPGDFLTDVVAGVPVLVVRGKDGVLRGFVNVCRHRGHLVASGCGNRSTLQCPYHAWTYGLDGSLRAAPRSEREEDFDLSQYPLLPIQIATWGPALFVNLDPRAETFEEVHGELLGAAAERGLDLGRMTHRSVEEWLFEANWKVFYDNSAECYHCPTVHPDFAKGYGVGPTEYLLESHESFVYHRSPVKPSNDGGAADWEMYAAWPNWSLATGEDSTVVFAYNFAPAGPERVRIVTHTLASPSVSDEAAAEELDWWRHIVLNEDRLVCEGVQRGLHSHQVKDGPLLLDSEHMIRRFQRKLRSAFGEKTAAYVS